MSEIKFSKDSYDTKMSYLAMMSGRINAFAGEAVYKGAIISETIDKFESLYTDMVQAVQFYRWGLDDAIQSMKNAGEALYEADMNAASIISA